MKRTATTDTVRLPLQEEPVSPVKILDAEGRLLRIVPAEEFRSPRASLRVPPSRRRERRSTEVVGGAAVS
jgi:hypothetical protein